MGSLCSKSDDEIEPKFQANSSPELIRQLGSRRPGTNWLSGSGSEPITVLTACGLTLNVHELETAQMVLQKAAEQLGLPKRAARVLKMEFVGAIVAPDQSMKAAGLCDRAEFVLLEKQRAEALVAAARGWWQRSRGSMDLCDAIKSGHTEAVEVCCELYPEKLDANRQVSCRPLWRAADSQADWVGRMEGLHCIPLV